MADVIWDDEPPPSTAAAAPGVVWDDEPIETSLGDKVSTFGAHAANQAALGSGDELVGGWKANAADLKRALSGDVSGALRSQFGGLKDLVGLGDKPDLSDMVAGRDGASEWTQTFRKERDATRAELDAMAARNPNSAMAGGVAGAIGSGFLLPGGAAMRGAGLGAKVLHGAKVGAGIGAAAGLGNSTADLTRGDVGGALLDTGLGGALGALGGAAGNAIAAGTSAVGRRVADWAGRGVAKADGAIDDLAHKAVLKQLASASGELGGEVQNANRLVENIMRLEDARALNPAQERLLSQLRASGQWDDLIRRAADSTLEKLPGQAGLVEGKRLIFENLQANKGQLFDEARAVAADPMKQVLPRVQRYAGPLLGYLGLPAAVGGGVGFAAGGDPADAAIGALAGAGMRPAAHAIRRMLTHPAVRRPLLQAIQQGGEAFTAELGRAGPLLARAAQAGEDELYILHRALADESPGYLRALMAALGLDDSEEQTPEPVAVR